MYSFKDCLYVLGMQNKNVLLTSKQSPLNIANKKQLMKYYSRNCFKGALSVKSACTNRLSHQMLK
jgi:hypothetical protein